MRNSRFGIQVTGAIWNCFYNSIPSPDDTSVFLFSTWDRRRLPISKVRGMPCQHSKHPVAAFSYIHRINTELYEF